MRLSLGKQVLHGVFDERRCGGWPAEDAATPRHGVQAELGKTDPLHFAIGRVIFDPVGVAPETIAMVQERRVLIRLQRQLIKPPAGQLAQPLDMRGEMLERRLVEVKRQQIAQRPVDLPKVKPAAIGCDLVGAARIGDRGEVSQSGHCSSPWDTACTASFGAG